MSVGSPTAGTWSSSQWRPDNEFETDRCVLGDGPAPEGSTPDEMPGASRGVRRWRRDSVGQTSGATQRGLNPGFSEKIGNSRRTRGSPQAWRTRPAHRQAHRRPTARAPPAAATSAHLPRKAAHTATGGASGRTRSRAPVMGPDVGLRGARRRPHGGHRSGWTRITPDRSPPRGRVRQPRWPQPPGIAAAHAPVPTRDRPGRSSTSERPAPGGTGRRRRRNSQRNACIASA